MLIGARLNIILNFIGVMMKWWWPRLVNSSIILYISIVSRQSNYHYLYHNNVCQYLMMIRFIQSPPRATFQPKTLQHRRQSGPVGLWHRMAMPYELRTRASVQQHTLIGPHPSIQHAQGLGTYTPQREVRKSWITPTTHLIESICHESLCFLTATLFGIEPNFYIHERAIDNAQCAPLQHCLYIGAQLVDVLG